METHGASAITGLLRRLARRVPPWMTLPAGLALVALCGLVDYATGSELSVSIFYLAPVAWAAWAGGRWQGLTLATIAAAVWGIVDGAGGSRYSNQLIHVWNSLVRLGFFTITAWLIGDVRRAQAAAHALARLDSLTGVANTRAFEEILDRELARMRRSGAALTLAYLDLDRFKSVNDALGHGAGDALLRAIGSRLTAGLRSTDAVARIGGDEFMLLLPNTDGPVASVVLERCLEGVRGAVGAVPGLPAGVGATIGAVVFGRPPASSAEAIQAADRRMYEGKATNPGGLSLTRWPPG